MLITNHQRDANANHSDVSSHTSHLSEWLSSINQQTGSAGEDVKKGKPQCFVGGNADW